LIKTTKESIIAAGLTEREYFELLKLRSMISLSALEGNQDVESMKSELEKVIDAYQKLKK